MWTETFLFSKRVKTAVCIMIAYRKVLYLNSGGIMFESRHAYQILWHYYCVPLIPSNEIHINQQTPPSRYFFNSPSTNIFLSYSLLCNTCSWKRIVKSGYRLYRREETTRQS